MRETNKATVQRRLKDLNYTRRYFVGNGIDMAVAMIHWHNFLDIFLSCTVCVLGMCKTAMDNI